jgi:outer membrane protein assembly factor BamA
MVELQDNGYFKAAVTPSTEQLSDKRGTHQFIITFDIDAGPQYGAGEIGFRNNHVFPADELRSMFKLASGDIFSVMKFRQGLNQMHRAYAEGANTSERVAEDHWLHLEPRWSSGQRGVSSPPEQRPTWKPALNDRGLNASPRH